MIVIGKPSQSIEAAIPYLATLPGVIAYNPEAGTLTFRRQPGFLTLYADRVYITQVNNAQEGLELLLALRDAINTTWENRSKLIAAQTARRAPRPLDIWSQLPQTNCKLCGEETCMAFACNLLVQKRSLEECVPLSSNLTYAEQLATLRALL